METRASIRATRGYKSPQAAKFLGLGHPAKDAVLPPERPHAKARLEADGISWLATATAAERTSGDDPHGLGRSTVQPTRAGRQRHARRKPASSASATVIAHISSRSGSITVLSYCWSNGRW